MKPPISGDIEVDGSFFGARRVKEKRGRGASGKTIVFGLLKRNGKVYTKIAPNCFRTMLKAVIRGKVDFQSTIHSDGWKGYDGLVDLGYKKHHRVQLRQNLYKLLLKLLKNSF
jgi:transposase